MPRVIGITGLGGSGKRTTASLLSIHHGFKLVKFADPLNDMLKAIGLGPAELEGHKKGLPNKILGGKSPRYARQTLMADWGRSIISDDLWVNIWRARAKQFLLDGTPVVCDDLKHENEAAVIKDFGGDIWEIRRPLSQRLTVTKGLPGHDGESNPAMRHSTHRVYNKGTLDELLAVVTGMMSL